MEMGKRVIQTEKGPKAIGPYSQAIQAGNLLFLSGQIPIDPKTGELTEGDICQQTQQVLENIKGLLESQRLGMEDVSEVDSRSGQASQKCGDRDRSHCPHA